VQNLKACTNPFSRSKTSFSNAVEKFNFAPY
jgi:hypothetical protein